MILSATFYLVIGFFISLLLCALFSFMETSITALRPFMVELLAQNNTKYTFLLNALRTEHYRVLTAMLIANSIATIITTIFSTRLSLALCSQDYASFAAPLVITLTSSAVLLCGEIIPKQLAKQFGYRLIRKMLWCAQATYRMLYPLVWVFTLISNKVIGYYIQEAREEPQYEDEHTIITEEILFLLAQLSQKNSISQSQELVLHNILHLSETSVLEIMTPISQKESGFPQYDELVPSSMRGDQALQFFHLSPDITLGVIDQAGEIIGSMTLQRLVDFVFILKAPRSALPARLESPYRNIRTY